MSLTKNKLRTGLVLLIFLAFIALGLPDSLMGVGWPSIRAGFAVPLDALGLLMITSTGGYIFSSFISGFLISRMGVGGLLAASCALTGLSLLGYTLVPAWGFMVFLGTFAGLGAGAIDSGLNAYAAENFSEGLMQWLHASYGIGVTMGPIIMTFALSSFDSWRLGYDVVAFAQLLLAAAFVLTLPLWSRKAKNTESEQTEKKEKLLTEFKTPMGSSIKQPAVWVSVALFFVYTGSEVALGAWAYTLLTESRGIDPTLAGFWAGSYWATFTIGRILAGLYAKRLGLHTLVRASFSLALLGAILLWWNPSNLVSLLGIALIGFAIAPVFPGMMSGTSRRVGLEHAANTIGLQMGGTALGSASIAGLMGVLARHISLEVIPLCLVILFIILLSLYLTAMQLENKRLNETVKEKAEAEAV